MTRTCRWRRPSRCSGSREATVPVVSQDAGSSSFAWVAEALVPFPVQQLTLGGGKSDINRPGLVLAKDH